MSEIKMSDVPSLSVTKAVDFLTLSYSNIIKSSLPLKTFPSVMLWGQPGIGKSQGVRQLADNLEKETDKKVNVTDVRLLLFNPIDLRGIPTSNADKTLAVWLKPKIFQMDESDDTINILFLDEISAAPQSVQAAAYQITLDRIIGEHKLPENCIVICAGNRVTDKSVVNKMPKALANRLLHLEVTNNFKSWNDWAIKNNIHEKVLGFLSFKNDYLNKFDPSNDSLAFPTPRSWEMVSNILNHVSNDVDKVLPLIEGLIGIGVALEFKSWSKIYKELPDIKEIFQGTCKKTPQSNDVIYALISSMTRYASEHRNELDKIRNSIVYAKNFSPDFSVTLLKNYLAIEKNYKSKLMKIPEFVRWLNDKGKLLNGIE